jgi:hypothetical protein
MKLWSVTIEFNNEKREIILSGERYSDVYIDVNTNYPGCIIMNIVEIPL